MKRLSRGRASLLGAVLLATLPLWTLPLGAAGTTGFLAYLTVSHAYYGGARLVFGAGFFPAHEFGIVPQGAAGVALAAATYGLLGAVAAWGLVALAKRRAGRRE